MGRYHFFTGYAIFKIKDKRPEQLFNLFLEEKMEVIKQESKEEYILVYVSLTDISYMQSLLNHAGFAFTHQKHGLPEVLYRYRLRFGVIIGILLAFGMLFLSGQTVWRVSVSGNENITSEEIRANLQEIGFSEGVFIPSAKPVEISAKYRANYDGVAYMSIRMQGTTAFVEVIETKKGENTQDTTPSNMVADVDAIIQKIDIGRGTVNVAVGDVVKKGDLLVSGILVGGHYTKLVKPVGEVYGRVTETIEVTVPFEHSKTVVKEKKLVFCQAHFFGFSWVLKNQLHKLDPTVATTQDRADYTLYNGKKLPISFDKTYRLIEEDISYTLEPDAALKEAITLANEKLNQLLLNGELVTKTLSVEIGDHASTASIVVVYDCIISKEIPILER